MIVECKPGPSPYTYGKEHAITAPYYVRAVVPGCENSTKIDIEIHKVPYACEEKTGGEPDAKLALTPDEARGLAIAILVAAERLERQSGFEFQEDQGFSRGGFILTVPQIASK